MVNLFNEMFKSPFLTSGSETYSTNSKIMNTNIVETDENFVFEIELPGIDKENISAELKDGYLVVTATKSDEDNISENGGKYIRRECFRGTCKRSFYVGDYLTEEDIKAHYADGVLKLEFPKEPEEIPEPPKMITID